MSDPEVTFDLDAELNDEGLPMQQALFSNTNNAAKLRVDGYSLVGRYAALRGVAQRIIVLAPIVITETGDLTIDYDINGGDF